MAARRYVYWQAALMILLIGATFASEYGQQIKKCRAKDKLDAPKYRIGRVRHAVLNNMPILLLQISIEPEHFNRSDMSELAHRLNKDFCNEKQLNVAICDDYRAAKDTYLIHDLLTHETNPGLRGFYDLNRVAGKEGISFSTERGKPLDEVTIKPNVR